MKTLRRLVFALVLSLSVGSAACTTGSIMGPHNPDGGSHNPDGGSHNPDGGSHNPDGGS